MLHFFCLILLFIKYRNMVNLCIFLKCLENYFWKLQFFSKKSTIRFINSFQNDRKFVYKFLINTNQFHHPVIYHGIFERISLSIQFPFTKSIFIQDQIDIKDIWPAREKNFIHTIFNLGYCSSFQRICYKLF